MLSLFVQSSKLDHKLHHLVPLPPPLLILNTTTERKLRMFRRAHYSNNCRFVISAWTACSTNNRGTQTGTNSRTTHQLLWAMNCSKMESPTPPPFVPYQEFVPSQKFANLHLHLLPLTRLVISNQAENEPRRRKGNTQELRLPPPTHHFAIILRITRYPI